MKKVIERKLIKSQFYIYIYIYIDMYIFVSSPGRSGTMYLSEIFKNKSNLQSYHGGEKKIRNIIDNKSYKNYNKKNLKKRIGLIKKLKNNNGYFESNQIFIHYLVKYSIKYLHL